MTGLLVWDVVTWTKASFRVYSDCLYTLGADVDSVQYFPFPGLYKGKFGMARYFTIVFAALIFSGAGFDAQAEDATAVESRLNSAIKYLAADDLEGRGVGSKGLEK